MGNWLVEYYFWLKALHIIGVISWMAGLLYLPRLFVYHSGEEVKPGTHMYTVFLTMERRLLQIIMRPALLLVLFTGGCLILVPGLVDWHQGWMHAKLASVFGLLVFHGFCEKWYGDFKREKCRRVADFFRMVNEMPTVLMIFIVILVVVKPF